MNNAVSAMSPLASPAINAPVPSVAPPMEPVPEPLSQDVGGIMFEDMFPPLDLSEEEKDSVASWLIRDLTKCQKHVNSMKGEWASYRSVYMMEYIQRFFPSITNCASFSSGVLLEKMIEGMDRMRLGIFSPRPYFMVDDRTSNVEDINFTHRAEWFLHTVMDDDLEIDKVIGLEGLFDFLLDGSLIVEADQMYEKIPQRKFVTVSSLDELMKIEDKVMNKADYEEAFDTLSSGENVLARLLVEEDVITKNGLQFFIVDKVDHLIPPNVYNDRDVRFRGRRMYFTENDLRLMASDNVGWYKKSDVDAVLNHRANSVNTYRDKNTSKESLSLTPLSYDWQRDTDKLSATESAVPYENTFAVYRVLAKYGYKTHSDKEGMIPKFCIFDIEPDSMKILRATTYPHLHERRNYFHFKLGVAPNSYWGLGFGKRLIEEDYLESNAVNLTLEGASLATYNPMLCVHPEFDGMIPFTSGIGPAKIGYVRQISDFKSLEIKPPSPMLVNMVTELVSSRASNRTSISELSQGKTESNDPRSPASKTALLLKEASIGMTSMIWDWNKTWEEIADFVWLCSYEKALYEGENIQDKKIVFSGMYPELEGTNTLTMEELSRTVKWRSQASSDYFNAEARLETFLKQYQFFMQQLSVIAQFNPEVFKKYYLRWMKQAGQAMNLANAKYLIPSEEELAGMTPEETQMLVERSTGQLQNGQSPGSINVKKGT